MTPSELTQHKLENASNLYKNFTGHQAKWLETRPQLKSGVWTKIGQADFLGFKVNGKLNEITFKKKEAELLVKDDGTKFAVIGKNLGQAEFKKYFRGMVKINYIGYTTKRDGCIEKYMHTFKTKARPQLRFSTRNSILSLGGAFDFTELGFVDRE